MPPKGYQSVGEEIIPVGTRVPRSWFPVIDKHVQTLRRQNPALRVSQSDALRDLIRLGMQSLGEQLSLFGAAEQSATASPTANALPAAEKIVEAAQRPAATAVEQGPTAPPGASAMEQAAAVAVDTPPFDATKFYLGKLCRRSHEYGSTGQSLLRLSNQNCPQCQREQKREKRPQAKGVRG